MFKIVVSLRSILCTLCFFLSSLNSSALYAHGGVALTDDVCVMSLGNLSAHFAIYQPETQLSKEFCEDIPDVTPSVFVIDFIHDVLGRMEVDFLILRDINNVGLSATWDDVLAISNLPEARAYYSPPGQYSDNSMTIEYGFSEKGTYIGVISARDPLTNKVYKAIFPFRVGASDFWDYLPIFLGLVILLETFYWLTSNAAKKSDKNLVNNQYVAKLS